MYVYVNISVAFSIPQTKDKQSKDKTEKKTEAAEDKKTKKEPYSFADGKNKTQW